MNPNMHNGDTTTYSQLSPLGAVPLLPPAAPAGLSLFSPALPVELEIDMVILGEYHP